MQVLTLYDGKTAINELYGYTEKMDAAYMRDTITPIGKDRKLPVTIQTYETSVDAISYEIRSLDGERLIANADVNSYDEKKGTIKAELEIQNLLQEGEEYLLLINLESGNDVIYYYTRIVEMPNAHVDESLKFVKEFHNTTFNSETSGTLSTYMEKTTGDNTTLQFVSLNSSLKQLAWADFNGEQLTTPVPSIKEITDTYNVIVLDYVVTSIGEGGESEYYNVEEYYRVRYSSSRMYLLNFERTMEEIFRAENGSIILSLGYAPEMWSIRRMRPEPRSLLYRRANSGVTMRRRIHSQKCSVSVDMKELTTVKITGNMISKLSGSMRREALIISYMAI